MRAHVVHERDFRHPLARGDAVVDELGNESDLRGKQVLQGFGRDRPRQRVDEDTALHREGSGGGGGGVDGHRGGEENC